jgi:ABC-type transport system involved in cytochrome bd biosynthesis fused ATPase/permease subunit
MYTSYKQTKVEYDLLMRLFDGKNSYKKKIQLNLEKNITIDNLVFEYPISKGKSRFCLKISKPITLNKGNVYLLKGDVSNGKSTFMDIVSGVIPTNKCFISSINIDDTFQKDGFEVITKSRLYCEQEPDIDWKPSIFEIVSDEDPTDCTTFNQTENNIWWSLEQACCADYFTFDKEDNEKKWIYTENVEPSPGLKACVRMAQIFYQLKTYNYAMVIGDELDASIKASRAVKAMKNLFNYCRENLILLIISAHTTEVQQLKYDKILNFNLGQISIEESI